MYTVSAFIEIFDNILKLLYIHCQWTISMMSIQNSVEFKTVHSCNLNTSLGKWSSSEFG